MFTGRILNIINFLKSIVSGTCWYLSSLEMLNPKRKIHCSYYRIKPVPIYEMYITIL